MDSNNLPKLISSFSGETILKGMPELAYVFNNQGEMLMWNRNVETVLGYSKEELLLKHIEGFIDYPDREKTLAAMNRIFSERVEQTVEYNLISKEGVVMPYIGSGSLAIIGGEEFFVGMAINISKLKEVESKLQDVVNETNRLKYLLQAENIYLRNEVENISDYNHIIGKSELIQNVLFRVENVAPTDSTVMLNGETGTDKEIFARIIHNKSKRKDKTFIMANCSSTSNVLTESELFGHEKGAFEGAIKKRIGKIELAHQGTLYLYEIGELSIYMQSKLLQLLREGSYERLGSSVTRKVDIRIIASTKHDIEELIAKGLFRADLYYSINVYPISIPPLRERIGDIPLLAEKFVQQFNRKFGKEVERISKKTINEMQRYYWPGNVRELENIIERAVILSSGSLLKVEPLLEKNENENTENLLPLAEYEKRYITKVLNRTLWRIEGPKGAALILDMHPETLRSRMRKLNIKRPSI